MGYTVWLKIFHWTKFAKPSRGEAQVLCVIFFFEEAEYLLLTIHMYSTSMQDQTYHINDHFSEGLSLIWFKMLQKVTIRIL